MSIENNICQAIDIIVDKAVKEAAYDKTILAQVIECIDATIGKYKIKYQDNICYAYTNNTDITYTKGTDVYILVPGGNLSNEKTILGTTAKMGINYISVAEGDEAYEYLGKNCIISNNKLQLSSYKTEERILYSSEKHNSSEIVLDINSVNEYIKNASVIICGGRFRTSLKPEHKTNGNYGIKFILLFKDEATEQIVEREYIIDINKMIGNPYELVHEKRQYGIFEIKKENFIEVSSISIFCTGFPIQKAEIKEEDYDIFIRDIELFGAERLKQEDLNSCSLSIITPQGTFYDENSNANDKKTLQAQVKVKGKVIDNNSQSLEYYWFIEHNGVAADSVYYNKYGGQGWKCLNGYTVLKGQKDEEPDIVEWIPGSYQWIVSKKDIIAKEVKYKCAVVYDGKVISKSVIIKNLDSDYNITIVSDDGTKFYYDIGSPTLTCLIGNQEQPNYSYVWAVENCDGQFKTLPETTNENTSYNETLSKYNNLKATIESTGVETAEQKEKLKQWRADLTNLKKLCRIEGNKIHNLQISSIVNFSTYKCSVYNDGIFLGTASIVITNSLQGEGVYSLIINEGTQVFKYDENGVSPTSTASLNQPIKLKALTFTIYDNSGKAIDDEVASHCNIEWTVPTSDTLLTIDNDMYKPVSKDDENYTATYNSLTSFVYGIEGRYNISKTRNNIQLAVDYKGMHLIANTNFTFVKEGDPGTNGTDFVCKILPNTNDKNIIPMVVNGKINYTPINTGKWLKAQLWEKEQCIYDGVTSTEDCKVTWKILSNKYSSEFKDPSHLSVTEEEGKFTYKDCENNDHSADIIQVKVVYKNKHYFATYTLPILHIYDDNYKAHLKEYTGFNYALFSSDGYRPKYDDANPFEIIVYKKYTNKNNNNFTWEDISLSKQDSEKLKYEFNIKGRVAIREGGEWKWKNSLLLEKDKVGENDAALKKNQCKVKVNDPYDGLCTSNAVECKVSLNNKVLLKLHLPVHLYLNRYGMAALNDWDGNSIEIANDKGYILTPQIGAGVKDSQTNTFTGLLMGKVNDAYEGGDAIGLIGYSDGYRSIFLDAETGKAEFGKTGDNQIIIEPGENKAVIQSGNFQTSGDKKGGLKIDFSKPEIIFGTGSFKVNEDGEITAQGGGSIAGWSISDTSLSAKNITISSDGSIFASTDDGSWYINGDGSASFSNVSVTGGSINVGGAFIVNSDGQVTASDMHITGGTITVGSHFSVANDGAVTASSMTIKGGYIEFGNFKVDSSGNLTASSVNLTGTINATGGKIGPLTINNDGLVYGSNYFYKNGFSAEGMTIPAAGLDFSDIEVSAKDVYDTATEGELRSRQNEKDITALETLVSSISNKVKELAGDITDIKNDIKSLESKLYSHSHSGGNSDE
jgi:hypothetical protein